jgi:endo-1,4-beta-xylanase
MIFAAILLLAAERGHEIPLWKNGAPNAMTGAAEVSTPAANAKYGGLPGRFTQVHNPSVYVFLPAKPATGPIPAMIVAPGGGNRQLVIEKEGWEIADWLNGRGIAAFVLKYRLAKAEGSKYTLEGDEHADAARAVRLVRARAAEWGVDPKKIGFIGFSAGGEVAGMIGTKYDGGDASSADPVERASSRPDFNVLIYPWYRPGANKPEAPPLFPVKADAPPSFLVCTHDDPSHAVPTVKFYLELQAAKIPVEMHIYEKGGHGFGLRPSANRVSAWPEQMLAWMGEHGFTP